MLAVARCRASVRRCRVWQIIPKHGNEAIRYLRTETAVGWQTLEHLHALLEQKIFVIERFTRRQCGDSFKRKFRVLHTHPFEVVHDRGFLERNVNFYPAGFADRELASLFFNPLDASADLPSLAAVGFFLIVPSNDRNVPGMVKNNS